MSAKVDSTNNAVNLENVSVVLLDVAGTVSGINFIKDTLFAYVIKNAEAFLKENWEKENVVAAVKKLDEKEITDAGKAFEIVKTLTEASSSNEGLKVIQGLVAEKGYSDGELKAHVFEDVPKALESWSKTKKIAIYSTGSIDSQKLFFKHTSSGDLSAHVAHYFDQTVGIKTEAASYKKIAEELAVKPEEVIFFTDNVAEAKAAKEAAIVVSLVEREGNEKISEEDAKTFDIVKSFAEIAEVAVKRKNEENENNEEPPAKIAKKEEEEVKDKVEPEVKEAEKVETTTEAMEVDSKTAPIEVTEKPLEKTETAAVESTKMEEVTSTEETKIVEETKTETDNAKTATETAEAETTKVEKTEDKKEATKVEENKVEVDSTNSEEKTNGKVEEKPTDKKEDEKTSTDKKEAEITTDNNKEVETEKEVKADEEKQTENGKAEKENSSEAANGLVEKENEETKVELSEEEIKSKKLEEVKKVEAADSAAAPVSAVA